MYAGMSLKHNAMHLESANPNTVFTCKFINTLTPYQIADILQTEFSNAFRRKEIFVYSLKFHESFFLGIKMTITIWWYDDNNDNDVDTSDYNDNIIMMKVMIIIIIINIIITNIIIIIIIIIVIIIIIFIIIIIIIIIIILLLLCYYCYNYYNWQSDDRPFPEPKMTQPTDAIWRHWP